MDVMFYIYCLCCDLGEYKIFVRINVKLLELLQFILHSCQKMVSVHYAQASLGLIIHCKGLHRGGVRIIFQGVLSHRKEYGSTCNLQDRVLRT